MVDLEGHVSTPAQFQPLWTTLQRWMHLHALMEEGGGGSVGLFAVLDSRFENVATLAGMTTAHTHVHELEHKVDDALRTGLGLATAFQAYREDNEKHLEAEEGVMMPKVMAMMKAGVPLRQVLREDIVSAAWSDEKFGPEFVQVAAEVLERHAGGMPRARVFLHALKALATQDQWNEWLPFVKKGLSPALYATMDEEIALDRAGL
jgi:hypothetical protein